jgi:hypothetical protein
MCIRLKVPSYRWVMSARNVSLSLSLLFLYSFSAVTTTSHHVPSARWMAGPRTARTPQDEALIGPEGQQFAIMGSDSRVI